RDLGDVPRDVGADELAVEVVVELEQLRAAVPHGGVEAAPQLVDDLLRVAELLVRSGGVVRLEGGDGAVEIEHEAVVEHREELRRRGGGERLTAELGEQCGLVHRVSYCCLLLALSPAIWLVSQLWVDCSWASRTSIAVNWETSCARRGSSRSSHLAIWVPRSLTTDSWEVIFWVIVPSDLLEARSATSCTRPATAWTIAMVPSAASARALAKTVLSREMAPYRSRLMPTLDGDFPSTGLVMADWRALVRKRIAESPGKRPPVITEVPEASVDVVAPVRAALSERTMATLLTSASASVTWASESVATVTLTGSGPTVSTVRSTPSSTPSKVFVALVSRWAEPEEGQRVTSASAAAASCVVATSAPP